MLLWKNATTTTTLSTQQLSVISVNALRKKYALRRQLFKYNCDGPLSDNSRLSWSHQMQPKALAVFAFSVSFLSRCERWPAALYDEVVGAPMACGCFLAWVCFFLTSGFAIYFFTGTDLVFFSPIPPPCFTSFPLSLIDLSFSIITFICAPTLEVAEIDIDAISANTCIDDTSSVNLSSLVETLFAGRDRMMIEGMILACVCSIEICTVQNVSTARDCRTCRGMMNHRTHTTITMWVQYVILIHSANYVMF